MGLYKLKKLKWVGVAFAALMLLFSYIQDMKNDAVRKEYNDDLDNQHKRMYEYSVKPLSGQKTTSKTGDRYWVDLEYGKLSKEQIELLISDIKNDGFEKPDLKEHRESKTFCKDKVVITIHDNDKSEEVRLHIGRNEYERKLEKSSNVSGQTNSIES
ncbi:MAG: hypothetical protein E7198_02010 [Schwartzia succinivorans]|nr:hypothetical protein [Schwartzia succinivorans]